MRIPEIILNREPLSVEGDLIEGFKYAGADRTGRKIGHRNKLGGTADWIQSNSSEPDCPTCKKQMTFFGQLDSINADFTIADCGMVYVFLCFDCFESSSIVQSY